MGSNTRAGSNPASATKNINMVLQIIHNDLFNINKNNVFDYIDKLNIKEKNKEKIIKYAKNHIFYENILKKNESTLNYAIYLLLNMNLNIINIHDNNIISIRGKIKKFNEFFLQINGFNKKLTEIKNFNLIINEYNNIFLKHENNSIYIYILFASFEILNNNIRLSSMICVD